jgi:fibronectin-binding autotransporter adhesin
MELTTTWQRLVTYTGNTADIKVANIVADAVAVSNTGTLTVGNIVASSKITSLTANIGNATSYVDMSSGNITATGSASVGSANITGNLTVNNIAVTTNVVANIITTTGNFNLGTSGNVTTAKAANTGALVTTYANANGPISMQVNGDLNVIGKLFANGGSGTTTIGNLTIDNAVFTLAANSTTTSYITSTSPHGIEMKYADASNTVTGAFMGIVAPVANVPKFALYTGVTVGGPSGMYDTHGSATLTPGALTMGALDATSANIAEIIVTGNLSGNLITSSISNTAGNISISATDTVNISTKANISGNTTIGGNLTVPNIIGANITATANNTISANTVSANYILGTIRTGPQPYITKVGTLSSLTVTGNITAGNINTTGTANFGAINLNSIKTNTISSGGAITLTSGNTVSAGTKYTITAVGATDWTSVGAASTATGNGVISNTVLQVTGVTGNLGANTYIKGTGIIAGTYIVAQTYNEAAYTTATAATSNTIIAVSNATSVASGQIAVVNGVTIGTVASANTTAKTVTMTTAVTVANSANIGFYTLVAGSPNGKNGLYTVSATQTVALTTITGQPLVGTVFTATQSSSLGANSSCQTMIPGTIEGAWKLTTGSTLQATYADLAERHHADAVYPTGTVMTVGGTNEITAANTACRVLGVVSDQWAYLMNGDAGTQDTHPAVAYVGRVPVRVVGPITKLSPVSPLDDGTAQAGLSNQFGWALETNLDESEKLVLCIIK